MPNASYYAGIDAGQSSTLAVVADGEGQILGRGRAGPGDEIGQGAGSSRLRDALRNALQDALAHAGLPAQTHFAQIVAGVSGYEGRIYGQAPDLPAGRLTLVHDSQNAHAGALGGEPGVVVIAGTGSVGYARGEKGASALVGGWGYLFGDEGSAFWLARRAISGAMRDRDSGEPNDLEPLAVAHFAQDSLRSLARAFYSGEITRARLASFGLLVLRMAEAGHQAAARHMREGAAALVDLAAQAIACVGLAADAQVAFTGGLTENAAYREAIAQHMHDRLPTTRHVAPRHDAATGALLLAYHAAGLAPDELR